MPAFTLYIQTNSPGELTSWVKPIVEEVCHQNPDATVIIVLTPCQYASGKEADIARAIPGVSRVYTPAETLRLVLSWPLRPPLKTSGAILYLGGDPQYSRLLGYKFKVPTYAYTEHKGSLKKGFSHVFYKEAGDLMAARIAQFKPNREAILQKYGLIHADNVLFFCGSRPQHFLALAPFMAQVAQEIQKTEPSFKPILAVSPFVSQHHVAQLQEKRLLEGLQVINGDSLELLSVAQFLITLPGTNTAEAMYLHVPMLVLIPLNRPDLIILDGLAGIIDKIPVLGTLVKRGVLAFLKRQKRAYSQPNRMSGQNLVPELAQTLTVPLVAHHILSYLNSESKRLKMVQNLARFMPDDGIVKTIVTRILG